MKLLCTGDWHIRATVPENRIDNYLEEQFGKLVHIMDIAAENVCDYILQPGDLFDTYSAPHWITARLIVLLKAYHDVHGIQLITIPGQHDLQNHKYLENSAMHTLQAARTLMVARPSICQATMHKAKTVVHGIGWNVPIEQVKEIELEKGFTNILLIHKTISDARAVFDVELGMPMLAELDFDLIVAGDNHKRFTIQQGDRHLVNCGSLMRMASDQMDHQPAVYVYDTHNRSLKEFLIPIAPSTEVFDLTRIDAAQHKKDADTRIAAFVTGLLSREETTINFKRNMLSAMDTMPISSLGQESREIIMGGM